MACRGLFDIIFQDTAHAVRVIGIHDQHDRLLEKGIRLLVGLLLQCQQPILPGDLRQFYQLLHIRSGIERLGPEHDLNMLWKGLGQFGITCDHNRQRTAHDNQNAGQVEEVPKAVW